MPERSFRNMFSPCSGAGTSAHLAVARMVRAQAARVRVAGDTDESARTDRSGREHPNDGDPAHLPDLGLGLGRLPCVLEHSDRTRRATARRKSRWASAVARNVTRANGVAIMKLTPEEARWLAAWLAERGKKMPSAGRFLPHYKADSWDLRDLFRAFRRDTREFRDTICQAVRQRATTGAWPEMRTEAAFWLRARWQAALSYCREASGTGTGSASATTPPRDVPAAIERLLSQLWDERFAEEWLREHARECICVEDESLDESKAELENFLRRLDPF